MQGTISVIRFGSVKYEILFISVLNEFVQVIDTFESDVYINTKIYLLTHDKMLKIFDGKIMDLNDIIIKHVEQVETVLDLDFYNVVLLFIEDTEFHKFDKEPDSVVSEYVKTDRYNKFMDTIANYILINY